MNQSCTSLVPSASAASNGVPWLYPRLSISATSAW